MNFKQLPNGMCEGFALLKKCDVKKTKNGAAYLDLVLGDKSDELPAKLWDYTDNGLFAPDMVVKVRGTVEQYNGRDQFRISQIRPAADSDNYNLSDLVPASEVGGAQIYDMLMRRVNAFQDADFKAIVSGIMEDHKEALVRLAESLCQIYPNVDKELLLSGAILHDVAKTWELEANNLGLVKGYTTEGELIGHLVKGAMYIDEKARDLGVAPEKAALLEHMLLSHHGQPEYGSPVRPMFLEAEILSQLDALDATIFEIHAATSKVEPGKFTDRQWALDNRKLFNHGRTTTEHKVNLGE